MEAEFTSAVPGVGLYWEDQLWGDMGPGLPPHRINTYKGHVWHVKKDGEVVHTFTVSGAGGPPYDEVLVVEDDSAAA